MEQSYVKYHLFLSLKQIASRVLGIPADLIYTSDSSTRSTPNCALTAGSMGTDVYGPAVMVIITLLINLATSTF